MADTKRLDEPGLEDLLSEPTDVARGGVRCVQGDVVVLGAGGKMGPTLAMMLKKADPKRNVYAVSRFNEEGLRRRIEDAGINTVELDLLDDSAYGRLPDVPNVFFLAGMKFGATGKETLSWAMNALLPGMVARHYRQARIVAFSTGNVYPFTDARSTGLTEATPPDPVGEYAWSCLARERVFCYFSEVYGTPVALIRLNYANEPRYGIIVDLTRKILEERAIDLTTGYVNLIWQADANNYVVAALTRVSSPPTVLNVAGAQVLSVREVAGRIAERLDRKAAFAGSEAPTALLSDASRCFEWFGRPPTSLEKMLDVIVPWVAGGHRTLNKPTKYDVRDGKF